jgi:hypothetical protein
VWDRLKKNSPSSGGAHATAPALSGPASADGAEASVRQLIANGKPKVALEAAKELHKARRTPASEALLMDAYGARIQSLVDQNLTVEAKALLDLVLERYPSARERLSDRSASMGTRAVRLEELVRPLNDPALGADRRAAIEGAVAREADLAGLAECAALPREHPLRQAALALERAFLAATAGPVGEEAVELPEVSHRSPLASWKLLVRAIACFYRGEDEACRRYLEAIKTESAAARLVPAMQAMLAAGEPTGLPPAAAALVSSVTSDPAVLRKALEALERAFHSHDEDVRILKAIRDAVKTCRDAAPNQIERLKQHISVRCGLADLSAEKVQAAMGGNSLHDAYFSRLFARGLERMGDPQNIASACAMWNQFRERAVQEAWFPANGPEAATLYLHMASVLRRLNHTELAGLQRTATRKSGESAEALYFLYPDKLYERACALDPHFESFSQWMEWAKGGRAGEAEKVAEAWHKIRPMDIEPILFLMEEKEKRNAFQSALQYLTKAERIDSVYPAVRQARLRLLAGAVLRHLRQKKTHPADEKLAEVAALPRSQQGDRPAFLAALRYMTEVVRGANDRAAVHRSEVERVLGSKAGAALLIFGVADACKRGESERPPLIGTFDKPERAGLPETVARVIELAKDFQIAQLIPEDWLMETGAQFARSSKSLTVAQFETLAEVGLCAKKFELAYAVSGAGLERGAAAEATFLLLRARSLPYNERRAVCAAAAAQLARQQRQMDVVDKAVELLAGSPFDALTVTTEQAAAVVRKEKAERAFPTVYRPGPDYSDLLEALACDCPDCRRARGERSDPLEHLEEDDDDFDIESLLDNMPLPPGIPPDIGKMMLAEALDAVARGESVDSVMNRLFGSQPGSGGKRKKGRRA